MYKVLACCRDSNMRSYSDLEINEINEPCFSATVFFVAVIVVLFYFLFF